MYVSNFLQVLLEIALRCSLCINSVFVQMALLQQVLTSLEA